ncbi:hypothetical protein NHQ30_003108 [Ciborinia camelliae]|nr:hypothetical protein NHQ30_003108 [Ciborinia camelliae]
MPGLRDIHDYRASPVEILLPSLIVAGLDTSHPFEVLKTDRSPTMIHFEDLISSGTFTIRQMFIQGLQIRSLDFVLTH